MSKWYAHNEEIFNLNRFNFICKCENFADSVGESSGRFEVLLCFEKNNLNYWYGDENYCTLIFDTEENRDKAFEDIKELLTK